MSKAMTALYLVKKPGHPGHQMETLTLALTQRPTRGKTIRKNRGFAPVLFVAKKFRRGRGWEMGWEWQAP